MIYLPIVGIVFCHRFGDVPSAGKATVEENLINQGFPSQGSVRENFSSHSLLNIFHFISLSLPKNFFSLNSHFIPPPLRFSSDTSHTPMSLSFFNVSLPSKFPLSHHFNSSLILQYISSKS